jgi:UDP-glucose 4-epimerase
MRYPITAVTGAGGFVGSGLVQHLRARNWPVIAVRRGVEASFDGNEARADITRPEHMARLVDQGFRADVIVHLAGLVQVSLAADATTAAGCRPGQAMVEPLYAANVLGAANVVDLARACGARKIVFASSQTVYGFGTQGTADENTPLRPLEHYAASKVCAERLLATAAEQGVSVVVLRFPGIYSPDRDNGAVYTMCRSALESGRITLRPECAIPFDILALADLLPAVEAAIQHQGGPFEVFNLSSGEACSLELLAEQIAAQVSGTQVEKAGASQPSFRMNATRANRMLNWCPAPTNQRLAEVLAALKK